MASKTSTTKVAGATPKKSTSQVGKYNKFIPKIRKRNGTVVPFDFSKIERAIAKAMHATGEGSPEEALMVAHRVVSDLVRTARKHKDFIPSVEGTQDEVERQLILSDYVTTAKSYILYRAERSKLRYAEGVQVPEHVRALTAESKKYFKDNPLGEFVYLRSYARWVKDEGRRETWIETVDRYMAFMKENLDKKLSPKEYAEIREAILKQEIMPSMRLMQFAGDAARRCNACAYNCSFIAPTQIPDFAEIMYLSMSGTGVGYSVESQNIQQLPQIKKQTGEKLKTFVVPDSKEGWCEALTLGLKTWYAGKDVDFDFSKLRPAGARLKVMGGKSSGPEPLRNLLSFARERIMYSQGRRLRNIDAHDIICKIGECVVAGGVRRSAMISLSDLDDDLVRDAKAGQFYMTDPHRAIANNSAVYEERPSNTQFIEEWVALMKSGTGERGIFNRGSLIDTLPERRVELLRKKYKNIEWAGEIGNLGTNPCVTADTWVMTDNGARQVQDLINTPFNAVVDGKSFSSPEGFFSTGTKQVFDVQTASGFSFQATENHEVLTVHHKTRKKQANIWKQIKDLQDGDRLVLHNHRGLSWEGSGTHKEGWLTGSLIGDGNIEKSGKVNLDFWGEHKETMMQHAVSLVHQTVGARADLVGHVAKTGYARVQSVQLGHYVSNFGISHGKKCVTEEIEKSSSAFTEGFLQGWFDADGSVQGTHEKGISIRLASSSLECLRRGQRMLARLGIISTIYENRRDAQLKMMPDGKGGVQEYLCKAQHELVVTNDSLHVFAHRVGFVDPEKRTKLTRALGAYKRVPNKEKFYTEVASITPSTIEEVYDCTVPGPHAFDGNGVYLHNCGEIILQSKQFCNLSEVICRKGDTEKTLLRKVRLATILGTYQSSLTHFEYLSKEWTENCSAERLLGVSLTGQWDCDTVRKPEVLKKLKAEVNKTNKKYADKLGIPQSSATTCVKPSGTVSQTFDCASGMHPRHAEYYIRRIRISSTDSLFKLLRDQAVPYHPEVGQSMEDANTYVFEFPVKAPEGAILKDHISAIDQLEHWKDVKVNYTEHNPSVTISIGDDEWIKVANWVYENWDIVGGLSFLPRSEHVYQLAPYEAIDKATYEKLYKTVEHIDYSKLLTYEKRDETDLKKELACAGGLCEIEI